MRNNHERQGTSEGRREGTGLGDGERPGLAADEWTAWWNSLSREDRVRERAMYLAYRDSQHVEDILDEMLDQLEEIDSQRDRRVA